VGDVASSYAARASARGSPARLATSRNRKRLLTKIERVLSVKDAQVLSLEIVEQPGTVLSSAKPEILAACDKYRLKNLLQIITHATRQGKQATSVKRRR
jgi:hypothetical protein